MQLSRLASIYLIRYSMCPPNQKKTKKWYSMCCGTRGRHTLSSEQHARHMMGSGGGGAREKNTRGTVLSSKG